jgi:hypothetical protein
MNSNMLLVINYTSPFLISMLDPIGNSWKNKDFPQEAFVIEFPGEKAVVELSWVLGI